MPAEPQIKVFDSAAELYRGAAEEFCRIGAEAIRKHGRFIVALSGGSTPRTLHQELATTFCSKLPWDKVYFFLGGRASCPAGFPGKQFPHGERDAALPPFRSCQEGFSHAW